MTRTARRVDSRLRDRDRAYRASAEDMTAATVADSTAREYLRNADPVLARVIDAHPAFRPRAWIDDLPGLDAFGTLIGIIGAGRFGHAMARVALRAGRSVVIANSRGPESLTSVVSALGEGAQTRESDRTGPP
jgi:phosphoglycerate dehydrogenase-like enzyme